MFSGSVYSTIEESGEADTLPVPEDKVKKFQASMENKLVMLKCICPQ